MAVADHWSGSAFGWFMAAHAREQIHTETPRSTADWSTAMSTAREWREVRRARHESLGPCVNFTCVWRANLEWHLIPKCVNPRPFLVETVRYWHDHGGTGASAHHKVENTYYR